MPAEPSLLTIDTAGLQETVGQLCAAQDGLETFLRGLFGDLDVLADEMTRHGRWVDSAKQDQDTERSTHEERLGRERQELESTFERIQELTDQLGSSATASSGGSAQLQEAFADIEEERSSLQAIVAASESQGAELARMASELAGARQDLAETRAELCTQRELLSQVPGEEESGAVSKLRDRLEQLEQERLGWTEERAVLETELDAVRTRTAELADTLDEEQQRAAGERRDWAEELRQMRELLQSLSDRTTGPAPALATPDVAAEPPERDDSQDPVLDSVMAQFEILQKDLARRRKTKPASK